MTDLIEAARTALDALDGLIDAQNGPPLVRHAASWLCAMNGASAAMQALRAAIEAAEKAKPVGMLHVSHYKSLENREFDYWGDLPDGHHSLYAALPAQQPARQPMTETEAWNCICSVGPSVFDLRLLAHLNQLVRAVEAFHRIGVKTVGPESQCQRKDPEPEITFLRRVADARQQIIDGMIAERCAKQDAEMPRPLADWHEDDGAVVWWRFLVDEPAWIGTPLDDDWPGYHTHWTPHPKLPERER